tara:strand:- start:145264 stop:146139 length:876 start_codon:yes stop_codon:yes gene_type:complete
MKYFPLTKGTFEHQFGIRALRENESIIEVTDQYASETSLKQSLLERAPGEYFQALSGSSRAQRDVATMVLAALKSLPDAHRPPALATENLTIKNLATDDAPPLLSISRRVQEDLTILRNDPANGFPLIAGCVCFPSGWCIADKIGQNLMDVHLPVPEFASALADATNNLLQRLKVGRPVWRTNWGVRPSGQLDQSPQHRAYLDEQLSQVDAENAGQRCYFRVERQTLARLPSDGDILFAIHTHQQPLDMLSLQEKQSLLGVIRSCPEPTLMYKGILPMRDAVTAYLQSEIH